MTRESKSAYQSISKARTFTPPSADETFVFAQLSRNLENACAKARRYGLLASRLVVFLRRQDFRSGGAEMKLSLPSAFPAQLSGPLKEGPRPSRRSLLIQIIVQTDIGEGLKQERQGRKHGRLRAHAV